MQIVLHNLETDEVALFVYEDWMSRTYGSKRTLICEMPAIIDDEEVVQLTTYIIAVKTSDVAGTQLYKPLHYTCCTLHMTTHKIHIGDTTPNYRIATATHKSIKAPLHPLPLINALC